MVLGTSALKPHKRKTKPYQNDTILQEKATKKQDLRRTGKRVRGNDQPE